ncbi:hypothetical protein GJ496_003644 [Pomphorhynchus laevis]|nr:hypothetical protein GJ496_003644 [Pomphorhynchus laevis]
MDRPRRSNAGNRLAKLLSGGELQDEFYKISMGGFSEDECDEDFKADSSGTDISASDIDITEDESSENGEPIDKNEDKRSKKVKFRKTLTNSDKPLKSSQDNKRRDDTLPLIDIQSGIDGEFTINDNRLSCEQTDDQSSPMCRRKSSRPSVLKHKPFAKLKNKKRASKLKLFIPRKPTQEEQMQEAKITEQINIASLASFDEVELENKKRKKTIKLNERGGEDFRIVHRSFIINGHSASWLSFTDESTFNEYCKV